jgi:hypothetical protein
MLVKYADMKVIQNNARNPLRVIPKKDRFKLHFPALFHQIEKIKNLAQGTCPHVPYPLLVNPPFNG